MPLAHSFSDLKHLRPFPCADGTGMLRYWTANVTFLVWRPFTNIPNKQTNTTLLISERDATCAPDSRQG